MSRYLITGARGQDGQIATQNLLSLGHSVGKLSHTPVPTGSPETPHFHWDWESEDRLVQILEEFQPDAVLNFAAHHHSSLENSKSFEHHKKMIDVNLSGLALIIQGILKACPKTHLAHASSSQIYMPTMGGYLANEESAHKPLTFYGTTKSAGMQMLEYYRAQYGLKASSVIFFNHESELRTENFVTKQISLNLAKIHLGQSKSLEIRNIGAAADFSSAYDAVQAMIDVCENRESQDFIISSKKATSIKELLEYSFSYLDLDWKEFTSFIADVPSAYVVGDNTKLVNTVGWKPRYTMRAVMESMLTYDIEAQKSKLDSNDRAVL